MEIKTRATCCSCDKCKDQIGEEPVIVKFLQWKSYKSHILHKRAFSTVFEVSH